MRAHRFMIAVVIFNQPTEYDASADCKLLCNRREGRVTHQIKINGDTLWRDGCQCLGQILIDPVNTMVVTQCLKGNPTLVGSACDRNRCRPCSSC